MLWKESKDEGKVAFTNQNYPEALNQYCKAIQQLTSSSNNSNINEGNSSSSSRNDSNHTEEHQILLSNVIACRLKIGGSEMINLAVEDAKKVSCFAGCYRAPYCLAFIIVCKHSVHNDRISTN